VPVALESAELAVLALEFGDDDPLADKE